MGGVEGTSALEGRGGVDGMMTLARIRGGMKEGGGQSREKH